MRKLLNQLMGREPEPAWMTFAVFILLVLGLPGLLILYAVAFGVKP
jgi:hypothetical protein